MVFEFHVYQVISYLIYNSFSPTKGILERSIEAPHDIRRVAMINRITLGAAEPFRKIPIQGVRSILIGK